MNLTGESVTKAIHAEIWSIDNCADRLFPHLVSLKQPFFTNSITFFVKKHAEQARQLGCVISVARRGQTRRDGHHDVFARLADKETKYLVQLDPAELEPVNERSQHITKEATPKYYRIILGSAA